MHSCFYKTVFGFINKWLLGSTLLVQPGQFGQIWTFFLQAEVVQWAIRYELLSKRFTKNKQQQQKTT